MPETSFTALLAIWFQAFSIDVKKSLAIALPLVVAGKEDFICIARLITS